MSQPELRLVHSVQDRFFPDAAFADFRKDFDAGVADLLSDPPRWP